MVRRLKRKSASLKGSRPKGSKQEPSGTQPLEGKIPHAILSDLLSRLTPPGREVIVGPAVGEDAFAVGVGRTTLVASTDPITFTRESVGYYAVNVNANDVATMGARPRWFLATALVPPSTPKRYLASLFEEVDAACVTLGIRLCGGHTEVTSAVTRPVLVGAMLGTVPRKDLVRPERAREGDRVLLTKRLALEGTSIIARERRHEVERLLGRRAAARARKFLFSPGISVVKEALLACDAARVNAMHDPTEGGFIWGLRELAMATGRGVEVDLDTVPVYDETAKICKHFSINPLGLIASGSLLIVASRTGAARIMRTLSCAGISCSDIGAVHGKRTVLRKNGKRVRFPSLKADEISRIL
jgi:hydrogenase maturation factor